MPSLPEPKTPFDLINNLATKARANEPRTVGELTNAILNVTSPTILPAEHWIRERVLRAEIAYRSETQSAVSEENAVAAMNEFSKAIGAPAWARTNTRQYRIVRASLKPLVPQLVGHVPTERNAFDWAPSMSPAEAMLVTCYLARAKAFELSFQVPPEEWITSILRHRSFAVGDAGAYVLTIRELPTLHSQILMAGSSGEFSLGTPGGALLERSLVTMGLQ